MNKINKIQATKRIIIGFIYLLIIVWGCDDKENPSPIVTEKKTIEVENPGENQDITTNLKAAYDSASFGDTLFLPEGTFKFTGSLSFSRAISLKGAGKNKTILYRPEDMTDAQLNNLHFISFVYTYREIPERVVISDITMKSKIPAGLNGLNGSLATDYGLVMDREVDFIIRDCRFENFGYAAINVKHKDDLARGLIYNNEFYHNFKGNGLGLGYGVAIFGENLQWVDSPNFGTDNFIFIEDNTFEYHRHSVAAGGCALYVARHNIIKNNLILHALDMHGSAGTVLGHPNHFAARAGEVYENDIINTKWEDGSTDVVPGDAAHIYQLTDHAIGFNGGESVIRDNFISGFTNGIRIIASSVCPTGRPLVSYQIGYDSRIAYGDDHTGTDAEHAKGDCFIWDNEFVYVNPSNPDNLPFEVYETECDLLKEHRDYHLEAKPGYTPYTYPHPLRSGN